MFGKNKKEKLHDKDVGFLDDAIFMLQHAVACEDHAKANFCMTGDERWLDIYKKLQNERSEFLYELIPESESANETYCLCKHLLGRAMGATELATRYLNIGMKEKSKKFFKLAFQYEQLFKFLVEGKMSKEEVVKKSKYLEGGKK